MKFKEGVLAVERVRIDNGIREIEVNGNGDCIYIPINDNTFFERVRSFLDWAEREKAALEVKLKSRTEADDETENIIDMQNELSRDMCEELDKLFGEGCCSKVFMGVKNPDIVLVLDFLGQLMPILRKFVQERKERAERVLDMLFDNATGDWQRVCDGFADIAQVTEDAIEALLM